MQYKTTLQSFPNVSLDGLQGPIALSKTSTGVDLLFFQNSSPPLGDSPQLTQALPISFPNC